MFPTFALEEFHEVRCRLAFYKLVANGKCPIDEFWREIEVEGNLSKQLARAVAIMQLFGDGHRLPDNKVKNITTRRDGVTMFEIKTQDLRIYFFRNSEGAIVVLGGKKSSQQKDITRFRNLANQYHISKKL